ncbi:MAG: hypothetical protein K0A98_00955 [Trueperaceae bacterium]|nr:hypothetical protein [Trueperaceae bacterium]
MKILQRVSLAVATLLLVGAASAQSPDWATEWSDRLGVALIAEFDTSGPDAWDREAHPLVFITTEGPGYSGLLSGRTAPGVAVIDAVTMEPVASASFELEGVEAYFEPHGLGVSPDGRWIYLPTGTSPGFGDVGGGRLLIIDAHTLKLHRVLATPTNPHHAKSFTHADGRELVLAYGFREGNFYVFDPAQDNRIVGGVENGSLLGRGYLGFVDPTGQYLLISVRPAAGVDAHGWVSVVDTSNWRVLRNIDTIDPDPIWVEFSADGSQAYVTGGKYSMVIRIAMDGPVTAWTVDGVANAGAIGPYGAHLNWDETRLWTVSKGEATHNRGNSMGLLNPQIMRPPPYAAWAPGPIAQVNTDCLRGDHGTVHPNPELDQLWVTCNGSFEIVVIDMFDEEVIDRIPMPNGGSTHSGAFVAYGPDGGRVLSDQNGLHGTAREAKLEILGLR